MSRCSNWHRTSWHDSLRSKVGLTDIRCRFLVLLCLHEEDMLLLVLAEDHNWKILGRTMQRLFVCVAEWKRTHGALSRIPFQAEDSLSACWLSWSISLRKICCQQIRQRPNQIKSRSWAQKLRKRAGPFRCGMEYCQSISKILPDLLKHLQRGHLKPWVTYWRRYASMKCL
jgi:hypothetical protein